MDLTKIRILCVGRDQRLLDCRCAVLAHNGYRVRAALFPLAYEELRSGNYDLVIISARHASQQNGAFSASLPPKTRTLQLEAFTHPETMLAAVDRVLQGDSPCDAVSRFPAFLSPY
jgi:hypothetical protein